MEIEYDPGKDEANRRKHGVTLALGAVVLMNRLGIAPDDRHEYGEERFNAFGIVNDRLYTCTYTIRGDCFRIISVRKSSRQEQRSWLS